jgi:hypothetical protein
VVEEEEKQDGDQRKQDGDQRKQRKQRKEEQIAINNYQVYV